MAQDTRFKLNNDLLQKQLSDFTNNGMLLRNLFSISTTHPIISVLFVLTFGVLVNSTYDLLTYPVFADAFDLKQLIMNAAFTALFALIAIWLVLRVKSMHKDLFTSLRLTEKKVLITLASKGRQDFKDTPAYNTYKSLLYGVQGQASINVLEKVILVATELAEVVDSATDFKTHIEAGGREAEVYGISINNKSILDIQKQLHAMIVKIKEDYPAYEIIADYTGGTKDMSIALLKASEAELIAPIYLNAATTGDHTKYS